MILCLLAPANSTHIIKWVNSLNNNKNTVHLITMHNYNSNDYHKDIIIHKLKKAAPYGYYLNAFSAKRMIEKIKPDILHTHYASGYGTLSRLINFSPTLLSVWGSDVYIYPYKNIVNKYIIKKNLAAATALASTSLSMRNQINLFITSNKEIEITPFGVDTDIFTPTENKDTKIRIGITKSLKKVYGIDYLLKVVAVTIEKLKENKLHHLANLIEVVIIGDGPERGNLEKLVKKLKLEEKVVFLGRLNPEEVPSHLTMFDIYGAFSISESFGVSVLEASSCKIPVLANNVGGLKEVVVEGETGYLVEPNNKKMAVEKLYKLVTEEKIRISLGENGRNFVINNYSWKESVSKIENLYKNILKGDKI